MDYILDGFRQALYLIFTFDGEVFNAVFISLRVSFTAIIFASIVGLPLGFLIAVKNFRGKRFLVTILNTLMALPTVVVGLMVYSFISRRGPFGFMDILYTPTAMIIGQFILAVPIITALTISAVQSVDAKVKETALTLGASSRQAASAVIFEAKLGLLVAVITGFGRIIGEVGAAMMLGGNIRGVTRTISTAIALQTSMGEFAVGIALGIILMLIHLVIVALLLNTIFPHFQRR
ncbi:ABC transporter permease subunit [Candidatus Poribacteria bacterium]|nr:ABC transporter permease subunit [Candidatus Poribacteria bacterium]